MSTTTTTGTLAAGESKTFTLAPGAAVSLTLSPNPRVTITETPESVSGSGVGGNTTRVHEPQLPGTFAYGPYAMGGVVVVAVASNSGSSVAWTRKDTVVTTSSDGTSLVSGDRNGSFLFNTWQDINVPLATGCTARPVYRTYIDAVNGNDAWDGSVPVWTGTTVGPKRTAVVANWTGTKTSWFTDEILLFAAGQTHTLTATGASIGLTTRKHLGAYWLPSAPNADKPVIKSLNNAGSAGALERACISASGTLSDISISDLTIDTSDVPNRFGISMYQTAAGQSINNITFSNVSVINGSITGTFGYGGFGITYYGQSATLAPYPESQNILYVDCDVTGYPGHGFVNSGTLGSVKYQVNGTGKLTATAQLTDTQTVVIAGITFTSVAVIGAAAGNFLIGASAAATLANLAALINAPSTTSATQVALSAANQGVLAALGAVATVSGNVLTLTFTAWDAAAYVSETQTNAQWSTSLVQTFARWGGVDLINCTASGCGAGYDTHGFTSYGGGVLLNQTSGGWTNTTSTIYYMDIDGKYGRDIPDIAMMTMDSGSGTELFNLLKNVTNPTTPAVGEFGFDNSGGTGALRLYANFGAVLTVANRFNICVRPTRGVRYIRCAALNQTLANRSGALEGHGFAFDDFTSDCAVIECVATGNAGHGVTINRGERNAVIATTISGNGYAGVKGNFGWGNYIGKCDISGSGFSDTLSPYKGFIHMSAASMKNYGPNGSYVGLLPLPNTYANIIASSTVKCTGTDTAVAALLGASSNNAPPLVAYDCTIDPGVGLVTDGGRAFTQGRRAAWTGLPYQVRGIGPQA